MAGTPSTQRLQPWAAGVGLSPDERDPGSGTWEGQRVGGPEESPLFTLHPRAGPIHSAPSPAGAPRRRRGFCFDCLSGKLHTVARRRHVRKGRPGHSGGPAGQPDAGALPLTLAAVPWGVGCRLPVPQPGARSPAVCPRLVSQDSPPHVLFLCPLKQTPADSADSASS